MKRSHSDIKKKKFNQKTSNFTEKNSGKKKKSN